ncbi:uncharacterized protein PGTG_12840 [Puccinia graminis f. sp. tritici CRL 75-36-700-3]|uniref:Uncharacterized protein n=1 Tax=Puccinia graminis f. sp. tritici (strain CRL 75-36-700-3 / race SCCL) TaxID=418459 RepID=E3KSH0_PUCGT|nr:uncharacterized protein PGTG_12840 [Puccinia graminis f. sp. tritici CRL 75-36-700-3]EFP87256.1 hypothetical protein PGTG_12840 [Puccinia graminis f. sp. tritici CRL 75-36-700-3]
MAQGATIRNICTILRLAIWSHPRPNNVAEALRRETPEAYIAANKRGTGRRRAQHESWSNLVSTVHGLPLPVSEEEEEACTDPSTHCVAPDYTSTYTSTTNLTSTQSD